MSGWVLDASALLALLHGEPGQEQVARCGEEGAAVSAVNLSEVVAKLADAGVPEPETRRIFDGLPLRIVDFDVELAFLAGGLRPLTRHLGLPLGDRACLTLAQRLRLPAVTADRAWRDLSVGVDVMVVRETSD